MAKDELKIVSFYIHKADNGYILTVTYEKNKPGDWVLSPDKRDRVIVCKDFEEVKDTMNHMLLEKSDGLQSH